MLAASWSADDDAGIICIEKVVDSSGGLRERKPKVSPGAEGIREHVHDGQEDNHTESVALVHP